MQFKDLNLIAPILNALDATGYTTPTPIQQEAIPVILDKRDVLGCAQTGTGKTAAFAIPILQLLSTSKPHAGKSHKPIKVLVLTPTRELAIQIEENFNQYAQELPIQNLVIFGGVGAQPQKDALRKGVDVLIATPGRFLDLYNQKYISLKNLDFFVLDEADRMLDMGFIHDVKKIVALLPHKRQTLFFSATMPTEIQKLADSLLHNPIKIEVTPESTTAEKINQSVYFVEKNEKKLLLLHILEQRNIDRVLIFSRTKHGADKIAKDLVKNGIAAEAIHGNKSQGARQRALSGFKDKKIKALVATDIAARGIDIDNLAFVINYDLPNIPESYVHRIGRTGRAGKDGTAVSFCDYDEYPYLKDIEKTIRIEIPVITEHPYAVEIRKKQTSNKSKQPGNREQITRQTNSSPAQKRGEKGNQSRNSIDFRTQKPNDNRPSNGDGDRNRPRKKRYRND